MNRLATDRFRTFCRLLQVVAILCSFGGAGCRSTDEPVSASFASVLLSGNTPGQIRDATVAVFVDNGYKARQTGPDAMVFEKEGSRMSNFAYGSWLGDSPVWIRVKASAVPTGEMKCRLSCTAYLVRDIGSAAEEELPVSHLHRGPYQKLLDEVARRLARK